ncbi:hypothetical protein FQA39_LY01722 [Lamprigera yunnana]|nr:hypothetical protein FQA39_LY01722 [Lamprigera yunnana]
MEITFKVTNLFLGILLIRLCCGFPIGLENSAADFHTQFITGLVGVLLIVCGVVFLIGCLCCQRRNGFKEFHNSPVVASSTVSLDHGHINPIANGEFTIFTPLSPPHHNNNVFLANEQIVGRTEINCNHSEIDVRSWFDGNERDFPRTRLKYIKELGRGWFGRVVEGAAQGLNGHYDCWTAVSVRILEASATSTERAVFLHDAGIYRCGTHPHILKLLGRSLESVPLLLLQELCPCGDLKKYLRDNQNNSGKLLSSELPLMWSCQISSALKFLHDHKLIHPDLAARNCQVVSEKVLKLGDYGLAATLYPEDYYQGAPAVPVRWCAPESLIYTSTTIQPKKITLEGNVWSLGVTLWEIFECGTQPYKSLSDDDVILQVIGSSNVRLAKPTSVVLYSDYIFRLMQLCWSTSESRPSVSQVHLMLSELMQVYENTKQVKTTENIILLQNFDKHWNSLKPNSVRRTDNQDFLQDSTSAGIDLTDIPLLNLDSNKDELLLNTKPMSPSLNNLHGSLDNLTNEGLDSWLQKVASNTGDMSYVRGLSEAISDLDNTLALENVSSSESSPAPENSVKSNNKVHFQLGPTDKSNEYSKTQLSSLTESMQRTSSESETEDENWRRKIEQGAYSEKVHQKSKSVTDLMILTHIDYSESDSETPLPSLDYRVNYKNVRYAPKQNLENVSLTFGSEGNLLSVHDKFQEELRRLQEERKDSLLFVPEYNRSDDTNKDYDTKLINVQSDFSISKNHNGNCTYLVKDNFIGCNEENDAATSQNVSSHRSPERLIEELSSHTAEIQPSNQVYNVFNVTVDATFNLKCNTDYCDVICFEQKKSFNVPKLTELIQSNDDLINYIICKYETEDDININSNTIDNISTTSKELNNNIHASAKSEEHVQSTDEFLQSETENCESIQPTVQFDISGNQDEVSPSSMTHSAVFTSTPFIKKTLDKSILKDVENDLQFSSNFDEIDISEGDKSNLKYSLDTWDNFLGEVMKDPTKCSEFDGFISEPPSLLFIDGEDLKNEIANCTHLETDKTFVKPNLNETVEPNDETIVLNKTEVLNKTKDLNSTYDLESTDSNQGWFLHPQSNSTVSGQMEHTEPKGSESYVGFSVDDEIVAALRNELLMKLPQAQGPPSAQQIEESEENWDAEERSEVLIKYNVYTAPLSPIPEESYSEDSHNFVCCRRNSTDSENDDWPEPYDGCNTPLADTETVSVQNIEGLIQEPPYRHTPSQDSCCSNDTLFNLEELTNVNEGECTKIDEVNKTFTLEEQKQEDTSCNESKTEDTMCEDTAETNLIDATYDLPKTIDSEEVNIDEIEKDSASHLQNNVLNVIKNDLHSSMTPGDNELSKFVEFNNSTNKHNKLNKVSDLVNTIEILTEEINGVAENVNKNINLELVNSVDLSDITLFLNCERQNSIPKLNFLEEDMPMDINKDLNTKSPDYINVDELNKLKLDVDYINSMENFMNINNQCDYVNVTKNNHATDIYEALTDIHFTGPTDMQMMSTSFSESVDMDEQDWDSGSDTRSSSSGEFIWKEGEHEESVKALRAAPQEMNSNEKCDMDDIDEISSESSEEDEDADSPEFVPSAWDKYATPTKSALRSPEKTLEKTEIKKQKGVWFKKQKYHCVYEYPREPESPVVNSYDLWQPVPASVLDWEVDTSPYIPSVDTTTSQIDLDKHSRNLYLGDFSTGMAGLDDEFYISGTAQPFEAYSGFASQFFPGHNASDQWMDLTKSYENITPDSGVEDITPASNSDNEYRQELKSQVQTLKTLATSVLKRTQVNSIKSNTKDCLGGLRHARNKLKLDLPPSPSAFTITKVFTIEPEEEPITKHEVPTFTTFGKSRFLVQHVDTPTLDEDNHNKNVSFEALPYKPLHIKGDKAKVEIRGEASLLDSADEDSGIESSTLERRKITTNLDD